MLRQDGVATLLTRTALAYKSRPTAEHLRALTRQLNTRTAFFPINIHIVHGQELCSQYGAAQRTHTTPRAPRFQRVAGVVTTGPDERRTQFMCTRTDDETLSASIHNLCV